MITSKDRSAFIRRRTVKNLLDIAAHVCIALALSFLVWKRSGSLAHVLIVICAGVLIDVDHFVDYLSVQRRFDLTLFFSTTYIEKGKVYLFLHSWELIALLFLLGFWLHSAGVFLCAFSLAVHVAVDNLQRRQPFVYFFIFRLINKFDVRKLFPDAEFLPEESRP
ncbi:MAG TPA: hypothetical protein VMD52_06045 [Patescibacteria group bacterium]|nr:hypothetical protein [Patescibacteria group bacterium]